MPHLPVTILFPSILGENRDFHFIGGISNQECLLVPKLNKGSLKTPTIKKTNNYFRLKMDGENYM